MQKNCKTKSCTDTNKCDSCMAKKACKMKSCPAGCKCDSCMAKKNAVDDAVKTVDVKTEAAKDAIGDAAKTVDTSEIAK